MVTGSKLSIRRSDATVTPKSAEKQHRQIGKPKPDHNSLSTGAAWMQGQVMPLADARLPVNDWGLIHSDITYDVVPVWNGAFFRLGDYLDRFENSMRALRMDIGMDGSQIRRALNDMVAASGLKEAYVAMVASRGVPLIPGTRDPRDCGNHFLSLIHI